MLLVARRTTSPTRQRPFSPARADRPAWCKGTGGAEAHGTLDDALGADLPRALGGIVQLQCAPRAGSTDDTAANRQAVEAARQRASTRLELTDAERTALPAPVVVAAPAASAVVLAGATRTYPPLETATP